MTGDFYTSENTKTVPTLTKEQAFELALKQIGAEKYLWDSPLDSKAMNYEKPVGRLVLLQRFKVEQQNKKVVN
jgi:hypothetical protein